ncbi:40S ribosomal protein S2, putative (macronuclear) [Tetrahymena thermophila SB210]|uniref:Small ribosomal subunit protein uS5 n=2 Tax=Tetrahymena thermophila TaxID=5911 RepID=Q23KG1_TETTS|nr:40S ribosomal protein S2, putative [Tetrahymena thermophila SB210]2XZN_E Chain E, Ribosomal Protein S5 Containing Protein [Tetrahymena thermophila]4BPN_E Chain E, 40s Ribosomal Protein Rps2e [Tetrahymena thermophila]4BPO_E Chain E, 40s Ribosomal Protein Rps2e [Tetrahymena thermophila]4BTS_AE Chain AE, 40S RIBOSOMAL PROTEIN RPS2E [Tetrahymena thermophila]4BTS_BE Chain BE, 40S RIBOSOMAL PROTEIN RPS2E [Tetrahymena thermophila]4BTS_CE Chain CE, 40S RIBOSOMAL PROTEIN RPS2E [Tetrahymena thermoph|eukprot:XP_001017127.3 40S ribosomal protein S2, putative [Tetrahymena thermophila SB210]
MAQRTEKRGFGNKKGPRGDRRGDKNDWQPQTKLGRLVKYGKISSLDEIFKYSIPIKEPEIIDHFYPKNKDVQAEHKLMEEVLQITPVQKQTQAGQRTRFKGFVVVGDSNGHIGLGWKVAKEVQGAIKGAITHAKLNMVPVRKGYWGNKIANAHTIPQKITGKSGSVRIRLVPAPRGTGIVAAPIPKKVLQFAGVQDIYTSSQGCTRTRGNFLKATYYALANTYRYLTPDFWGKPEDNELPFETFSEFLHTKAQKKEPKQYENKREKKHFDRPRREHGDRQPRGEKKTEEVPATEAQ